MHELLHLPHKYRWMMLRCADSRSARWHGHDSPVNGRENPSGQYRGSIHAYGQFQISFHLSLLNSTGPSNLPNLGGPVPGSGRHIQSLMQPGTSCLL
jgi:hypothetical protein